MPRHARSRSSLDIQTAWVFGQDCTGQEIGTVAAEITVRGIAVRRALPYYFASLDNELVCNVVS
jgi:hypothetical protein